jgi:Domain of unknown function (DUF4198)
VPTMLHASLRAAWLSVSAGWLIIASTLYASAHEFWIDPVQFAPSLGARVPIVLRIGQHFNGSTYPFVRALSQRFVVADSRGERPVKTLDGDDPAAEIAFPNVGLAIVAHQRKPEEVIFATFEKFREAAEYEGLETALSVHQAQGKPLTTIRELYARCAKSLLSVGGRTDGADRAMGMPLELIAVKNPYETAAGESLPIRLVYKGQPVANVLVKVFNRNDPKSPRLARTDAEGQVRIESSTRGEFLVSAVHMVEAPRDGTAHWLSYWASLTFERR